MRHNLYRYDSGTDDGEVVILWVARIVREKGLGSFVRTVQELLRMKASGEITGLPAFRVVVAGDGPDLRWMRRQGWHFFSTTYFVSSTISTACV